MESKQQSQPHEDYLAPAGVELGTLAEMTAGSKSGPSGDICKGAPYPSTQ